ncbi:MAG: FAD-binding protein [Candidatus Electrothrix sp. AU1_5]|nr:FAD-binding protein [Candidatus Electrothrix gigas]
MKRDRPHIKAAKVERISMREETNMFSRRDFLRISAMASAAALVNWQIPVFAQDQGAGEGEYDVIVIGAGLGGLSCAALFAMNGRRPLVIDKRDVAGGYASSFQRGDFVCETSLHAVTGNPLNHALLQQLGVWDKLSFAPHSSSWTSIFPDFSASLPQPPFQLLQPFLQPPIDIAGLSSQLDGYLNLVFFNQDSSVGPAGIYSTLVDIFPDEQEGLSGYMQCWRELLTDIIKFYSAEHGMPSDITLFPVEYPTWAALLWKNKKIKAQTLDDLFKEYKIKNPQLKAILGQTCGYYGLPSAELPAWFYLMNTGLYHAFGAFYLQGNPENSPADVDLQGTSQDLSNLLVSSITDPPTPPESDYPFLGGTVLLDTEVTEIIVEDGKAVGVKVIDPVEGSVAYRANAVISNASVPDTFDKLLPASAVPATFTKNISRYQPSLSHFNVWLGLDMSQDKNDGFIEAYEKLGTSTAFYANDDDKKLFHASQKCDPEGTMIAVVAYDKLAYSISHSPEGYASLTLTMLCGYEPWEQFEEVYKSYYQISNEQVSEPVTIDDYYAKKDDVTDTMIRIIEEKALPGLSDRVVMKDSSTPLTNVRYTCNPGGAIYGYEQALDNSGLNRVGNRTPIPGLYLSSAWTNPGGGFEMVMISGKETVKCIIEDWNNT